MPPKTKKPPTRRSKISYIKRIVGYQLWKLSEEELEQHYEDAKATQREMRVAKKATQEQE